MDEAHAWPRFSLSKRVSSSSISGSSSASEMGQPKSSRRFSRTTYPLHSSQWLSTRSNGVFSPIADIPPIAQLPFVSDVSSMYRVDVFTVDPASVAHGHWVALIALGLTAVLSALLVMRLGRRSWWAIIVAAIAVPTITTLAAGGAWPGPDWPLSDFMFDVVMPLAVVGFAAAAVGSAVGALLRWLVRRKAS